MPQYFEVSIITNKKVERDTWTEFSLFNEEDKYDGYLEFFQGHTVICKEYNDDGFYEYEFSINYKGIFKRSDIISKIRLLTKGIEIISKKIEINFAIANVESNSLFLNNVSTFKYPSKEMLLKSSLIFVPKAMLDKLELNLNHMLFFENYMCCLFNPTSGLLYSIESEEYAILKESFNWKNDV